jgi:D-glycero-D-manno-heptose 1,7-bisphosphate phosphatase
MTRAVFLDRDGVLNVPEVRDGLPFPPKTLEGFRIYPEASEACAMLRQAGFLLVLTTNQPDVGRGEQSLDAVEQMHAHLRKAVALDRIEICTAADSNAPDAHRRKPAPGMVLDAAKALNIDLPRSYLVGDRWRDVECGHAAGCTTIFIERGYAEKLRRPPHHYAANVLEAARLILRLEKARLAADT